MSTKIITVFGATGQQGGAVIRGLLAKGGYKIRGVTRNPDGDKAKALKEKGVEIVKASLDDAASVEAAVKESYGVFLVTNYWEFMNKEREIKQGKTAADACKKAGVKHLIYSGLESVKDKIGLDCPHFDGKGEVEKYLDEIQLPNTSVRMSFYYENFLTMLPQKQDDGSYVLTLYMKGEMDAVGIEECGPAIAAVFAQPEEFIGKKIGLSGDRMTMEQYVEKINEIAKVKYIYNKMSYEDYSKLYKGSDDIANMFEFYIRGNPDRDIVLTKQLDPNTKSFAEWVEANKDKF